MAVNNLTPINRNSLYYSEEDFQYECDLLEEYLEEDLNQVVILYEVDRHKTNINSIYKETSNIRFKPPREIPCLYQIKQSELKSYDTKTSNGVYAVSGGLTFYTMATILEKYNLDVKRGDYIGVPLDVNRIIYFSVVDDGKMNSANESYIGAYKPVWRTVQCAPVSHEEFSGK